MEYLNKRTGAVIDSPCLISGDDWVMVDDQEIIGEDDNQEVDDTQGIDSDLTVSEIKAILDERGMKYPPKAKKPDLLELLGE